MRGAQLGMGQVEGFGAEMDDGDRVVEHEQSAVRLDAAGEVQGRGQAVSENRIGQCHGHVC